MILTVASHYAVHPLRSMADVRANFPKGHADGLNWLVCSTSGVHGDYGSLDEAEAALQAGEQPAVTVLIIKPRLCTLHYGHLPITADDIALLRGLVASTLAAIAESQEGNVLANRDLGWW